jgi:hypothetical protein
MGYRNEEKAMRVNILCAGKVLGAAIKTESGVAYAARPFAMDKLASLAETEAHCTEFNARGYGQPIYAKLAAECRYNEQAR